MRCRSAERASTVIIFCYRQVYYQQGSGHEATIAAYVPVAVSLSQMLLVSSSAHALIATARAAIKVPASNILGLLVKHATVGAAIGDYTRAADSPLASVKGGITLYLVIMIARRLGSVRRDLSGIVLRSWNFVYAARHHTIRGIA
jgi:hypothetical protein